MYLNINAYGVMSLSCNVHRLQNDPFSFTPILNNRFTIYFFLNFILLLFLFLISRKLKHDDLAAAFSTTSLTEFE